MAVPINSAHIHQLPTSYRGLGPSLCDRRRDVCHFSPCYGLVYLMIYSQSDLPRIYYKHHVR